MRLPPSWRLVGRARARLFGRARARMYAGLLLGVVAAGACAHVCAGLLGGTSASVAWSWRLGDVRQTQIIERFTRCGSNALDSEALHYLLPSAMLRQVVQCH